MAACLKCGEKVSVCGCPGPEAACPMCGRVDIVHSEERCKDAYRSGIEAGPVDVVRSIADVLGITGDENRAAMLLESVLDARRGAGYRAGAEAAAKVCDAYGEELGSEDYYWIAHDCAEKIRALLEDK